MKVTLASASARRKVLLKMILRNFGLKFTVKPANIVEYIPKKYSNYPLLVKKLSKEKASYIYKNNDDIVIGADTIVVHKGKVLGKPSSKNQAKYMLKMLSGNTHKVYTGITVINGLNGIHQDYEVSTVRFRDLKNSEIDYYISTDSPMDKAGSYGIQDDYGSTFVECIHGDYFNIVGLPVVKTYLILQKIFEKRNIVL